jgi:predicted esterase
MSPVSSPRARRASVLVICLLGFAFAAAHRSGESAAAPAEPASSAGRPAPAPVRLVPEPEDLAPASGPANTLLADEPTLLASPPHTPTLTFGGRAHPVNRTIVFLHGMCDTPENECAFLHEAATHFGDLLCPRANGRCANGNAIWRGSLAERRSPVDAALAAIEARRGPGGAPGRQMVLFGFSQGAYEAVNLVASKPGPYTHLLLIGANVEPDARTLLGRGIRSVLMASGDFDQAMPTMKRSARALAQAGLRARFESLGRVGHAFAPDMRAWTEHALGWLLDEPPAAVTATEHGAASIFTGQTAEAARTETARDAVGIRRKLEITSAL